MRGGIESIAPFLTPTLPFGGLPPLDMPEEFHCFQNDQSIFVPKSFDPSLKTNSTFKNY